MFTNFSIHVDSYKSFSNGIDINDVSLVNILVGKNNSGKSNIIEVLNLIFKATFETDRHRNEIPKVKLMFINTFEELKESKYLSNNSSRFNRYDYERVVNKQSLESTIRDKTVMWDFKNDNHGDKIRMNIESEVTSSKLYAISSCCCFHIQAERTIVPEEKISLSSGSGILKNIRPNGEGLTNLLRYILNSKLDSKHYKQKLIEGMNGILEPEISIKDLEIKSENDDNLFEIYVEENGKPLYPLSTLGSGIKTTMHLIMMTELIPELINKDKGSIVFTLEELENNMHPSAQRRMYRYIQEYARRNGSLFFISSHSNVSLNYFFGTKDASVYHIIQNSGVSEIFPIMGQRDSREIMDDIGANPSDLLQSNGIIWVEGPSDRIYIKKWLELAGFGNYVEGYHYQFMYYGGRLLSHYSTEETDSLVNMLKTNRHSALVMDSDKKKRNSPINDTKKRIKKEFKENGLITWCTKGKEIENYLLGKDIMEAYPDLESYEIEQFQPFLEFDRKHDKISFAKKVTNCMNSDSLLSYDLKDQIKKLGEEVTRWNGGMI